MALVWGGLIGFLCFILGGDAAVPVWGSETRYAKQRVNSAR